MILILSLALASSVSFAKETSSIFISENLKWDTQNIKKNPREIELQKMREFAQAKNVSACLQSADKAKVLFPQLGPWIIQQEVSCALSDKSAKASESLEKAIHSFETKKLSCLESPAWKTLRPGLQKAYEQLIEAGLPKNSKKLGVWIDAYQAMFEDKESRAKAMAWQGIVAVSQHDLSLAENLFQQSLSLNENKNIRDRLNAAQLALNSKKTEAQTSKIEYTTEAEVQFEERFRVSQKTNDLIALAEDCVVYLNQFPNGRRAKWAQEKLVELYSGFSEKTDEKYLSLREKVLSQMTKLHPSRGLEIVKIFHRKADYSSALSLADQLIAKNRNSPEFGMIIYIAGRSAQFVGDYSKARKYFEFFLDSQASLDEVFEVQFRLGLVHLRERNYSSAVAVFERLVATRGSDKFDLLARYWLIRALQKMENVRSLDEIHSLIAKYPLSYYGLRLQTEISSGVLEKIPLFSKAELLERKIVWTRFQKQAWDKAVLLGRNGWIAEALAELSNLSQGIDPVAKALLAQRLSQNGIFSLAIRGVGEALDADPNLQSIELISVGLPDSYLSQIETLAAKRSLNPILVQSLIRQESAFNERATSSSKAMGLMQLIPPTATEVAQDLKLSGLDLPEDSYLPQVNLQMGTFYIAKMIRQFNGVIPLGLAAYNAGPARMELFRKARPEIWAPSADQETWMDELWFDELPWAETSFYVKAILRNTILYRLKSGQKVQLKANLWSDLVRSE